MWSRFLNTFELFYPYLSIWLTIIPIYQTAGYLYRHKNWRCFCGSGTGRRLRTNTRHVKKKKASVCWVGQYQHIMKTTAICLRWSRYNQGIPKLSLLDKMTCDRWPNRSCIKAFEGQQKYLEFGIGDKNLEYSVFIVCPLYGGSARKSNFYHSRTGRTDDVL